MDEEALVLSFVSFLKSNLNGFLAEIETRKGDGIELDDIDSGAYYIQELSDNFPNSLPCVLVSIESEGEGSTSGQSNRVTIFCEVMISDKLSADSTLLFKRCMRYRSALSKAIAAYPFPAAARKTKSLPVVKIALKTTSQNFYTVGLGIEFHTAN